MDIVIHKLNKSFGTLPVLVNLELTIPKGQTTCIMGPSGCGKTTLAHILLGLYPPDSGTITGLEGLRLSAVFQENRLVETADALTNLRLVSQRYSTADLLQRLKRIGLTDFERKPVSELSGGMKRRVAILRALIADYDFLVLDEPFKGLDQALREQVIAYVHQESSGKTVLLITHDKTECTLLNGRIINL